tara:strand:+ start:6830 stop:7888 length:1059 start_codon:yes stop_codon:yes gene_type:complete
MFDFFYKIVWRLIRSILFLFPPEFSHKYTFKFIKFFFKLPLTKSIEKSRYIIKNNSLERNLFGLKFANPVGLAAGFDKNADLINEIDAFGFSFIEIGTVTPEPQFGNEKPRVFRLKKDEALINRLGFNNEGLEKIIKRLKNKKTNTIIGGNIGKNKNTPIEDSVQDYKKSFNQLFNYVDYFVLNVSSPNTPKLRELQKKEKLEVLISSIQSINNTKLLPKPILIKISPDLNYNELDSIIELVKKYKINGIVATNSTNKRENLKTKENLVRKIGAGGLTGRPIKNKSTDVIKYIHQKSSGTIPIIGVGGINSVEDAIEKIDAGASLIQLYTGFIYQGPLLVKKINQEILKRYR